jgi:hypothetical protein
MMLGKPNGKAVCDVNARLQRPHQSYSQQSTNGVRGVEAPEGHPVPKLWVGYRRCNMSNAIYCGNVFIETVIGHRWHLRALSETPPAGYKKQPSLKIMSKLESPILDLAQFDCNLNIFCDFRIIYIA